MRTPSSSCLLLTVAALSASLASAQPNPERNAYFGETHIHTSWSVDAWLMGNRLTGPDDAYKYAQGQTIKHPLGYDIKIDTPMDFMGVTDHSEYVGVTKEANTPGSALSKLPEAQPLILKDPNDQAEIQKVFTSLVNMLSKPPIKAFMSPEVAGSIWNQNVKIADANNHPGKFTAFCSYEYTSQNDNRNLHRNIFFRDCAKVPEMPYSSLDSWHPEDLWKWMDGQRKAGNELLARARRRPAAGSPRRPASPASMRGGHRWAGASAARRRDRSRKPGRARGGRPWPGKVRARRESGFRARSNRAPTAPPRRARTASLKNFLNSFISLEAFCDATSIVLKPVVK